MTSEIGTILVLAVATVIVYFAVNKLVGVKLNAFGLVLLWPIVMALVNDYTVPVKITGAVLVLASIYLLSRSVRKSRSSS